METATKITSGASVILLIASIVMGAGLLNQKNVYVCLDKQIAMVCDKLSAASSGISTRCYYMDIATNKSTYKICNSGWQKFEQSIPVNLTSSSDFVCDNSTLVKECRNDEGVRILRIRQE